MPRPFIVFDVETALDKAAAARAYKVDPNDPEGLTAAVGDFPKTPFHRIVAIAAMTITYDAFDKRWAVREMATLHTNGGDDADIVRLFLQYLHCTAPIVVSYNGASFDLPVVRARSMIHRISAPALASEAFKPFSRDHLDLCDLLWGRGRDRLTLDQSGRVFGLGTKTEGVDGSKVDDLARAGEFDTIAAYCLDDVVLTAGLFLLYQTWQNTFDVGRLDGAMDSLRHARDRTVAGRSTGFIRSNPMPLVPEL
jgi:predicted PolB exonuclease-like 3'-5' exonuclease